jgi:dTDP-4-amino-4,6-dideoxygalactose transaminase
MLSHQKLTVKLGDLFAGKQSMDSLSMYIGNEERSWTSSGRAALKHILQSENVKNVGVPAFTCHVVLDAIKRSGKNPVVFDSEEVASVEDIKSVTDSGKLDALVLPYNFGFMADSENIAKICKQKKVLLIEDCAQALGAELNGKKAGEFGKYAFYSFGISKNIGFVGGLIRGKRVKIVNGKMPLGFRFKLNIEAGINKLFFSNILYGLSRRVLEKELQIAHDDFDYDMPESYKNVVMKIANRYDEILKVRRENAKICIEELEGVIDFVKPMKGSKAAWLYFVLKSKERNTLRKRLLGERVDVQSLLTFRNLGEKKNRKAEQITNNHLIFAMYRNKNDVDFFVKKVKKVSKEI